MRHGNIMYFNFDEPYCGCDNHTCYRAYSVLQQRSAQSLPSFGPPVQGTGDIIAGSTWDILVRPALSPPGPDFCFPFPVPVPHPLPLDLPLMPDSRGQSVFAPLRFPIPRSHSPERWKLPAKHGG